MHDALRDGRQRRSAAGERVLSLMPARTAALAAVSGDRKMVILASERILRRLYDWRDLQIAAITAQLLIDRQEALSKETADFGRRTVGRNGMLSEVQLKELRTLSLRQRSILDTQTELERQLGHMIEFAERAGHTAILAHLKAPFLLLRQNDVSDHLKRTVKLIEDNQPLAASDEQNQPLSILRKVAEGFLFAGQQVEKDQPLDPDTQLDEDGQRVVEDQDVPARGPARE